MDVQNRQENFKISIHSDKWRAIMFILFIPDKIKGILLPPVSGASSSNIVDCFVLLQASLNHTHTHTYTHTHAHTRTHTNK